MSKKAKDRMCNHEVIEQNYEKIKFSTNTNNNNRKSSLKRTESKMDENQQVSDDYPKAESETEDSQWRIQNRSNKRGIKSPQIESFFRRRTITSSSHGSGRTEKNLTRHVNFMK
jgi:hypothetical protein